MDLAKLCKVWGVMKYYHPEIISGNVNWDYEIFRVMPYILEEDSDANSILYEWVRSYNSKLYFENIDDQYQFSEDSIQIRPSTDWCKDEKYLGKNLSLELSRILIPIFGIEKMHMLVLEIVYPTHLWIMKTHIQT